MVAGSLILAAALAPAVHHAIATTWSGKPFPFSRVFDRVALAIALLFVVLLRRAFPFAAAWRLLRAESWPVRARRAALGFALAALPTVAALPLIVGAGGLRWSGAGVPDLAAELLLALPAALLVSLLEEGFFRTLVFRGLAVRLPVPAAALASSALYAFAHVVSPDHRFVAGSASPAAGLDYLATLGGRLVAGRTPATAIGLALIGLVLCLTLQRTSSFALCVGLHTGWSVAAKVAILATTSPAGLGTAGSVAKRAIFLSHPAVWVAVALAGAAVLLLARRRTGPVEPVG